MELAVAADVGNLVDERYLSENRQTVAVVTGIDRDDAPVTILQAEEAGLLAQHVSRIAKTQLGKQHIEVAATVGVHLVIAVQRKAATRSKRPGDGIVVVVGVSDAEAVFVYRQRIAYVIDIADVDGEVGDEVLHLRGHG